MKLSEQVLKVLRSEAIGEAELAEMLRESCITRIRGANQRYFHWLFRVEGGSLKWMQHADVMEVGDGQTRMLEDHEDCAGEGCHDCGWVGKIGRWITDKPVPRRETLDEFMSGRRRAS
jgi:hypothetical protein